MSGAFSLDADDLPRLDTVDRGVVVVHDYGYAHYAASCSCGWAARRRYLSAAAQLDAWQHSIYEKCDVSVPLTVPVTET